MHDLEDDLRVLLALALDAELRDAAAWIVDQLMQLEDQQPFCDPDRGRLQGTV